MNDVPKFLRRATVPSAPPPINPLQQGLEQWDELRRNYMLVTDELHQTQANALEVSVENDSLRQQLDNLKTDTAAEIASLKAENRWLDNYATGLRTRMTVIKEAIITMETEALKYADHGSRQQQQSTPEEEADVKRIVGSIVHVNERDQ